MGSTFKDKVAWYLQGQAFMFAYFGAIALGLGWAWTVGAAWLGDRPLLYGLNATTSPETKFVFGLAALQAFALVWNLIEARIFRKPYASLFLTACSLPVALYAGVVLAVWSWLLKPDPRASYLPLGGLVVFSALLGILHRFGPLASPERDRVQRSVSPGNEGAVSSTASMSRPTTTFASIFGNEAVKERLKEAANAVITSSKDGAKPRNGILLHGEPGNGKTIFAEALAGELRLPLISLSYADVASQWVGEKSARVRAAFDQAKSNQPCVLFLDEVDSFIEDRGGRADGVKEDRDLTNALLTLMVDIRVHRVILVAATNHMDRLDAAAVREGRFDFKVEITPPDAEARGKLLWNGLRANLPGFRVDEEVVAAVAQRWNGFSVKRILAVTEELPSYMKGQGDRKAIGYEDFMGALRQLQGQRGAKPENVKKLSEIMMSEDTRESLDLIAGRLADPEHTEKHGGTLPTGVLFSGPPGTGKTVTAKALAAEIGWAFLTTTGAELARAPAKLEELYTKAKDLRPTLIFIDEADELLRSREYSATTDATNKLLTLMDGVGDRVRDVVWVAATNHPESIDSALLRGGRFTEKVRFHLPDGSAMAGFVAAWLEQRKVQLAPELSAADVAAAIGQESIANAEAVLQAALNRAIARRTTPVVVGAADLQHAQRSVLAD